MTATPQSQLDATAPADDQKIIVKCAALTKVFKDFWMRPRVRAVNDVDLEIHEGQVFGLLGPNGSGKSTTIKLILGLLHPTSGQIAVLGRRPEDVDSKKEIGYLPEESYLYRFLNARETLDYYGRLFHQPRNTRRKRIDMLLEMVGLEAAQNRPVGEYSKGMQRRIGIAQALINDPKLLILDEPTTGMDPIGTRQIKDLLIRLRERGKTILLCSHLLADVEDVCDRVSIMFGGKVVAHGTLDELLVDQQTTTFQTENLDDQTVQQIENVLEKHGKHIEKVTRPRQSLESKFLDLVHEEQKKGSETSGAKAGGKIAGFLDSDERSGHMPEDVEAAALLNQLTTPAASTTEDSTAEPAVTTEPRAEKEATPVTASTDATQPASAPADSSVLAELSEPKQPDPAPATTTASKTDDDVDTSVLDGLVVPSAASTVPAEPTESVDEPEQETTTTTTPEQKSQEAPSSDSTVTVDAPVSTDTTDETDTQGEHEIDSASETDAENQAEGSVVTESESADESASTSESEKVDQSPNEAASNEPPPPLVAEETGESGTNLADAVDTDESSDPPGDTSASGDTSDSGDVPPEPRRSESGETPDQSFIEALENLDPKSKGRGPKDA